MTRNDHWRQDYRARRYLQYRSTDFVNDRLRYLFENILTLTPHGKIGFAGIMPTGQRDPEGIRLWESFTHVLEEYGLRGMTWPPADEIGIRRVTPGIPKGQLAFEGRKERRPGQLFRFGRRVHLEETLALGRFRLAPAAGYRDPSLNRAVRDDELTFKYHLMPNDLHLRLPDGTPLVVKSGASDVAFNLPVGFYVVCFSTGFHLRLFEDFEADSCLVVYDSNRFLTALADAVRHRLPESAISSSTVLYIDPCRAPPKPPPMPFAKHVRYWYQHEFRFVVVPRREVDSDAALGPIAVEVGPMHEFAELIVND